MIGKGYSFMDDSGRVFLVRCHRCGKENYLPAVASGQCAWCGFSPGVGEDPSRADMGSGMPPSESEKVVHP